MITDLNYLAKMILALTHEGFMIPLLMTGYLWIHREFFFHNIFLILLSMMLNTALKVTFQIPLNPSIGKAGFAFPSGHMQTATVFYGSLYTLTRNKTLKLMLMVLLILIGSSLIKLDYHNLWDVTGAVLSGSTIIYLDQQLKEKISSNKLFLGMIGLASLCLGYIKYRHVIPPHLWTAYYALIGLLISHHYFNLEKAKETLDKKIKSVSTVCCFSFWFFINAVFELNPCTTLAPLRWFCMGVFIPFSVFLSNLIFKKKK